MIEYKPNSHKYKAEQAAKEKAQEKRAEKVVTGTTKVRKKSEARKLTEVFVAEDISNVKSYVFMDVLVPALKEAFYSMIMEGLSMSLFGGSRSHKGGSSKVSYRSYSDDPRDRERKRAHSDPRNRFDFDEIEFDTRGDAEYVLEQMEEILDNYKMVRVLDLYDLAGLTPPFTADKYGWTNLRSARTERVRGGGFIIKLPRPAQID